MTDSMTGLNPRLHTRLCDLVGVEYPIVQTGICLLYTSPSPRDS